jgi:hypothetical protein
MVAKKAWDTRARKEILRELVMVIIRSSPPGKVIGTAEWAIRLAGIVNLKLYRKYKKLKRKIRRN